MQEEFEGAKEACAFHENKVTKLEAQRGAMQKTHAQMEDDAATLEHTIKEMQNRLDLLLAGTDHTQVYAEVDRRASDMGLALKASSSKELELQQGLTHLQGVHEALLKENEISQEVLEETLLNLQGKEADLNKETGRYNDKLSECLELTEQLEMSLTDQDRKEALLTDVNRRYQALVDDREGLEKTHQAQMEEMMGELRSRKGRAMAQAAGNEENPRFSSVESAQAEVARLRGVMQAKEEEGFEGNFELQSAQSKAKLVETQRDQVKARLEDEAHKLQEAEAQLAKLHAEADTAAAELREARAAAELHEAEATRCRAELRVAQEAVGEAGAVVEAGKGGVEGQEVAEKELEALRKDMSSWLQDMQVLKESENRAKEEVAAAHEEKDVVERERNTLMVSLDMASSQIDELNATNSKLIGHHNAAQKVQHTMKIKEENNTLKASNQKAVSDLAKEKRKGQILETEVNKMRKAMELEGSAQEMVAQEENVQRRVEVKEAQCQAIQGQLSNLVRDTLAAAGPEDASADEPIEARATAALEGLRTKMAEQQRLLAAAHQETQARDFANDLLRKELQLKGGPPAVLDVENLQPNLA